MSKNKIRLEEKDEGIDIPSVLMSLVDNQNSRSFYKAVLSLGVINGGVNVAA